jgi:hypothetical protein
MAPYWVLDSPYLALLVKMVLAAGNVTRTMPWTSPAALTTVRSDFEAIRSPSNSNTQDVPTCAGCRSLPPARALPSLSQDEAVGGWPLSGQNPGYSTWLPNRAALAGMVLRITASGSK